MSARDPVFRRVAEFVQDQIADGVLKPGQLAPSGDQLHRATGYNRAACRKALRLLVETGVLAPGAGDGCRPRIPGLPGTPPPGSDDAARELSGALAGRRRAAGLTQPELAALTGVSVTAIGHAETGRLWHGRSFWEQADQVLAAGGEILALHDTYQDARTATAKGTMSTAGRASLTGVEREAVRRAGHLYEYIAANVIADGPTRHDDLAELRSAVHVIQRMVLAQAAARAYPLQFRLLGGTEPEFTQSALRGGAAGEPASGPPAPTSG